MSRWRKAVVDSLPEVLSDNRKRDNLIKEYEKEKQELYAEIGELTSKLNWLKKNLELNLIPISIKISSSLSISRSTNLLVLRGSLSEY